MIVSDNRYFASAALLALLGAFVIVTSGCTAQGINNQRRVLRDRIKANQRATADALSPLLDPWGGAVTEQGREVERNLSRE